MTISSDDIPVRLDQIVDDVMRRQPATIAVFLRYRMLCVGCFIAPFHSVEDACCAHGIEPETFLAALQAAGKPEEAEAGEESKS